MRHKQNIRKFGRDPKHRKALLRNLTTNLVTHERIVTTLEKAKEMRSLVEKVIHKAKQNDYQGNHFLFNTLFTKKAINHAKTTLAPRYEKLKGGFTRIKFLGLRRNDRARMCYIELVKNPIEIYEKNTMDKEKQELGLPSFWSWELKILRQEQDHFKTQIENLKAKIEQEIEEVITQDQKAAQSQGDFTSQIRKEVEGRYQKQIKFLEAGLQRASFEEKIHLKQQGSNKYERLFEQYAFPPVFKQQKEAQMA